jgi:hypothetical protein
MVLVALLLPLALVLVALSRAYGEVDDDFLVEWSAAHALALTPANRPMVRWYLRNARVLRTWGVLAGIGLPPLAFAAFGIGETRVPQDWTWIFVGYLVGALYAELSLVRPRGAGPRSASVVPRDLDQYLPARMLRAQRGVGLAAVIGAFVVGGLPYGERSQGAEPPNTAMILVLGLIAAAFAVGLERLQRWLIERPQPFTDPELLAADDAIRSQSVHSLAGSGIAVLLLLAGTMCWAMSASDLQVLRWVMWVPAVLSFLAALYACLYFGHRAWRVRRPSAAARLAS